MSIHECRSENSAGFTEGAFAAPRGRPRSLSETSQKGSSRKSVSWSSMSPQPMSGAYFFANSPRAAAAPAVARGTRFIVTWFPCAAAFLICSALVASLPDAILMPGGAELLDLDCCRRPVRELDDDVHARVGPARTGRLLSWGGWLRSALITSSSAPCYRGHGHISCPRVCYRGQDTAPSNKLTSVAASRTRRNAFTSPTCLSRLASHLEQRGARHEERRAPRARDRHVEPVAAVEELGPAGRLVGRRRGHRVDDDGRLCPWNSATVRLSLRAPASAGARHARCRGRRSRCPDAPAARLAVAVGPGGVGVGEALDDARDRCASSIDSLRFPRCGTGRNGVRCTRGSGASSSMRDRSGRESQAAVVERPRDGPAHVGVHPPRLLEEEAALGGHRRRVAEDVSERRDARLRGGCTPFCG